MKLISLIKNENFQTILNLLVAIITISGVGFFTLIRPFKETIPFIRHTLYETKIEDISIGCSRKYVESLFSIPKREKTIEFNISNKESVNITRCDYINKDFILTMFYFPDNSTMGYSAISLSEHLNPKIPYNNQAKPSLNSLELQKHSLNEYSGFPGYFLYSSSSRNDTSAYYIELSYHHLSTNDQIIGYGYSTLGDFYNNNSSNTYNTDYLKENIIKIYNTIDDVNIKPTFYSDTKESLYPNTLKNIIDFKDANDKLEKESFFYDFRNTIKPNVALVIDGSENKSYKWDTDAAIKFLNNEISSSYLFTYGEIKLLN